MEVTADRLNELIKCHSYHERAPEWGDRAWIAHGEYADVVYWDISNSWCDIVHVQVKGGGEDWLKWFYDEILRQPDTVGSEAGQ
jgi:hypothetical protein